MAQFNDTEGVIMVREAPAKKLISPPTDLCKKNDVTAAYVSNNPSIRETPSGLQLAKHPLQASKQVWKRELQKRFCFGTGSEVEKLDQLLMDTSRDFESSKDLHKHQNTQHDAAEQRKLDASEVMLARGS